MAGRPEAKIDWDRVNTLLESGCFTTEIAAHFGISVDTLYRRCLTDHNIKYTEYSRQKKARGESLLRAAQFKNAMQGNTTMQVWLGKQRLDQRDKPKEEDAKDNILQKLAQAIGDIDGQHKEEKKETVENIQPIFD